MTEQSWTFWVGSFAAVLAIVGVILNNRKKIACFPVWICSNLIICCLHTYAAYHGASGMLPLAVRDLVFLALAVEGLKRWRRIEKEG